MIEYLSQRTGIIQRMHFVQQEMAHRYGEFVLFALFEREDWPSKWDVVVSATWMGESIRKSIDMVFDTFDQFLTSEDKITISQVIVLKPGEPFVQQVLSFMQAQHQTNSLFFEFSNQEFNVIEFRRGYVLQWQASALNASASAAA